MLVGQFLLPKYILSHSAKVEVEVEGVKSSRLDRQLDKVEMVRSGRAKAVYWRREGGVKREGVRRKRPEEGC